MISVNAMRTTEKYTEAFFVEYSAKLKRAGYRPDAIRGRVLDLKQAVKKERRRNGK